MCRLFPTIFPISPNSPSIWTRFVALDSCGLGELVDTKGAPLYRVVWAGDASWDFCGHFLLFYILLLVIFVFLIYFLLRRDQRESYGTFWKLADVFRVSCI